MRSGVGRASILLIRIAGVAEASEHLRPGSPVFERISSLYISLRDDKRRTFRRRVGYRFTTKDGDALIRLPLPAGSFHVTIFERGRILLETDASAPGEISLTLD